MKDCLAVVGIVICTAAAMGMLGILGAVLFAKAPDFSESSERQQAENDLDAQAGGER